MATATEHADVVIGVSANGWPRRACASCLLKGGHAYPPGSFPLYNPSFAVFVGTF